MVFSSACFVYRLCFFFSCVIWCMNENLCVIYNTTISNAANKQQSTATVTTHHTIPHHTPNRYRKVLTNGKDPNWNTRVDLCVFIVRLKLTVAVGFHLTAHGKTARPPRWAITFVLFLVVNKAESDDIIRFCELDDVLPLLPLPVPYPLSIFMAFPFASTFVSNGQEDKMWNTTEASKYEWKRKKITWKRNRKNFYRIFNYSTKRKSYAIHSNAQHVESVLFVLFFYFFPLNF